MSKLKIIGNTSLAGISEFLLWLHNFLLSLFQTQQYVMFFDHLTVRSNYTYLLCEFGYHFTTEDFWINNFIIQIVFSPWYHPCIKNIEYNPINVIFFFGAISNIK